MVLCFHGVESILEKGDSSCNQYYFFLLFQLYYEQLYHPVLLDAVRAKS